MFDVIIALVAIVIITFSITPLWSRINRLLWGTKPHLFIDDVILLTGSAGGIGRSLTPKLFQHTPRGVVLIDYDTTALDQQHHQLGQLSQYNLQLYYYSKDLELISQPAPVHGRPSTRHLNSSQQPQFPLPIVVILIQADITHPNLFTHLTPIFLQHFPSSNDQCPITMLVNNAGIIRPVSLPSVFSTTPTPTHANNIQFQHRQISIPPPQPLNQLDNHLNEAAQLQQLIYNVNTHAPINLAHALLHSHSTPIPHDPTQISQQQAQDKPSIQHRLQLQIHFSLQTPPQLHIITIASAASMSYSSQLSAYCGSKAAVVQSLRAMRFEHQRLLHDPSTPIKYPPPPIPPPPPPPPPQTSIISFQQQQDRHLDNAERRYQFQQFPFTTPSESQLHTSHSPTPQRNLYTTTPRYIPAPDATHREKMLSLLKSILAQLFPFLSQSLRVPFTYKDHNVLAQPTPHVHWSTIMPWHIDTSMFNNIYASPLIKFFLPSLSRHDVADHILQQLTNSAIDTRYFGPHSTYSESVLPFLLTFTPLFSLVPIWLSDALVGFAGGWHAMDDWQDPRLKTN